MKRSYPKPNATSKAAVAHTEAYYRMISNQTPPPMGFDALRKAAKGKPVDKEEDAERAALRQGDLP